MDPIDENLLSAWVDGQLDGPDHEVERRQVEAWLRDHPEDAAKARLWAADAQALRMRLAPLLDEPIPERLRQVVMPPVQPRRWALAATVAAVFLLGGLVGGALTWQLQERRSAARVAGTAGGWVQRAALAHSVYVPEPRHAVEVKAQEEHLARWLTRRIDIPVKLFDLRAQGFELVGGRLLPDGPGKSAQLMYQDNQGLRVTVYLRKPDQGVETAFRYERQGDLGMFYWIEAGAGYALVGNLPRAQLLALAEGIYRQCQPGAAAP